MAGLLEVLERTPAWRDGAVRVLDRHGEALKRLSDPPPRLLLRLGELILVSGLSGPPVAIARELAGRPLEPELRDRLRFLARRAAVRVPDVPVPEPGGSEAPLERMRDALVDAEWHTFRQAHAAARAAALARVLEVPEDEAAGLHADELRFEAASGLAQLRLPAGEAKEAVALLEQAAALARRYESPHDEASLQLWRYLAYQQLGDYEAMFEVGRRAAALPEGAIGALRGAAAHQLAAAEAVRGGDPVAGIRRLDKGLSEAVAAQDWTGFAALAQAKFLALHGLGEPYGAFRSLKLAAARLRRSPVSELGLALDRLQERFRRELGEARWEAYGERLMAELREA